VLHGQDVITRPGRVWPVRARRRVQRKSRRGRRNGTRRVYNGREKVRPLAR